MTFELPERYNSIVVDYSIIREMGGTSLFSAFLDYLVGSGKPVYVGKNFKLLHYCVIHQADDKNYSVASSMRDFCSLLLANQQLHTIQAVGFSDLIDKVELLDSPCIVTTSRSIFIKRLFEHGRSGKAAVAILSVEGIDLYDDIADCLDNMPQVVISPLASQNKYLDASVFCNIGDTVMTGKQKPVTLVTRVSSGAEGMVFTTDNPKIVAKIYHRNVITPLRWSKLTRMVSMGIKSIGICWPQDLLFYKGIPVGYTMIMGKGKTLGNVFDGPDAIVNNFPAWKRIDIVETLIELLEKYIYLHMHDIVAGDIQLKNALLHSSNSVFLIDMDSVQVGNLPCPVGTEEFTDPALWGKNFAGFLRKLQDEDYSIAMLVFSILFCGLHPYATRNGAETLREEIIERNFPYTLDDSDEEHIPRGGYNYIWQYLPENIRKMLYSVFAKGERIEAIEWYEAVVDYKEMLAGHKIDDEEAYKVFPKMDYKMTAEAVEKKPVSQPVNVSYRSPFKGADDPNVYHGGISGLGRTNPEPKPSPFKPAGSQYVPKAAGNVPTQSASNRQPDPDQDSGLFKKFKKGLFG